MDYCPHTQEDSEQMQAVIGVKSIDELFDDIPQKYRIKNIPGVPPPLSEHETMELLKSIAARNSMPSMTLTGAGAYAHFIPSVVGHITGRAEFYTAYTPYQAEISQGILQATYEYQTMIAHLTGTEVANASMYDGASAMAEAAILAAKISGRSRILVARSVHPQYRQVLSTYLWANGFILSLIPVLFPPSFPRADQVSDWVRSLSALGAALIFRFYPHANLRNFYRGAFPFIAAALFLLTFSPYRTLARFSLEGGLAFLDLYAWLLLVYFASRAGAGRGTVINLGIFIIFFAGTASHYHVLLHSAGALFPDESNIASFALLGIFLLLLMLAIWDGREASIPIGPDASSVKDPQGLLAGNKGETAELSADETEKGQDMALRMKLMEFNLTRQETEIALLLLKGAKDLNICSLLYISRNTLKYHLRNIYRKTGSSNRRQLKSIFD